MSDNKTKKGNPDSSRINTNEVYEVSYWTEKWNISKRQLIAASAATGSTNVKKIEKYLKERGKI